MQRDPRVAEGTLVFYFWGIDGYASWWRAQPLWWRTYQHVWWRFTPWGSRERRLRQMTRGRLEARAEGEVE